MNLPHLAGDAKLNQAAQLAQKGQLTEASSLCQQVVQLSPQNARAWHLLGLTSMQQGQKQQALTSLQKAIALNPSKAEFYNHTGVLHFSLGNLDQGIACLQEALALEPQSVDTRYNLALGLQKLGRWEAAIKEYQHIIAQQPHYVPALVQLGIISQQQKQYEQALSYNRQAVAIQPENAQAWCNLAVTLQEVGDLTEAETAYQRALTINPQYVEACNGLGSLLEKKRQATQAIAYYQQALSLKPDFLSALINLGNVRSRLKQWQSARTTYRQVLSLDAHNSQALDGLLKVQLASCQWGELEALTTQLWSIAQNQSGVISPFQTLYLPFSSQQQQILAQNHARGIAQKMSSRLHQLNLTLTQSKIKNRKSKIKLGYVSGDFRNHAVAQLMLRLFELHDRDRFAVFAYSLGPDDGSKYRQKLMRDCDCFRDMVNLTPTESAQQIYDDGIDILIDLAGYTEYAAPEIFALRPAPLQVNYLGYPGTLGADYMDYIITDSVITPPHLENFFTEQCLYLPDSYQLNNNQQPLPEETTSKAEWGLPEEAFIFCCFNKSEKIEPDIFAAWMRILKQVDNSVLWLLESNPEAQQNLTTVADSLGIDQQRLIFAPRLPKEEHLTRHAGADLFLDTHYYNAHTTGSDSLWAGIPLITLPGETFASRVAASLLTAARLPQLITENLKEYASLAVHLAQHPLELQEIKLHLRNNRKQLPLFDTHRTVGHLEAAYRLIWERYLSGKSPQAIQVPPEMETVEHEVETTLSNPSLNLANSESQSAIACQADRGFQIWLAQSGGSLAISTYQGGKVAMVGWNGQQVTLLLRQFTKPMGLALQGNRLALATKHEVLLFANAQNLSYHYILDQPGRYDTLYLPRTTYFTGDINVHDLAFGDEGLWLVNSRFSCLATLSDEFTFVPRWQPSFISELAPEDRCHLNGLAMVDGQPKYVTALGESDEVEGWRSQKADGGILLDVETGEILLRGLSMPHSPRWHQGALWFLNSGKGELCRFDPNTRESQVICTLPGFGRGLCFVDNYALMGLSQIRERHIFGGLPLQERFQQLTCGLAVVDCRSGQLVGLFEFTSGVQELYEVQFIPGRTRPNILNPEDSGVRDAFTTPDFAYWLRSQSVPEG